MLERSPDVPENGLAVRSSLPSDLKARIQQALLHMHEDPEGARVLKEFGARRFIETTDEDYGSVLSYAVTAGLDLARYDYRNE